MVSLSTLNDHEVLPVEQVGDLLVVTPAGDPVGFSQTVFRAELTRVKQLASGPTVRNVLVDFSQADYFGSAMVGSLLELRHAVAVSHGQEITDDEVSTATIEAGGVTAVCGLSDDMMAGLGILNVDSLLHTFEDRREGIRKLANLSLAQRIGRVNVPWYPLSAASLLVAVVCLFVFTPLGFAVFGGSAVGDFKDVTSVYERWERRTRTAMTKEERLKVTQPYRDELRALRDNLRDREVSPARRSVAIASGRLTFWIDSPADFELRTKFRDSIAEARQLIFEETGLEVDVPPSLGVADVKMAANNEPAKTGMNHRGANAVTVGQLLP